MAAYFQLLDKTTGKAESFAKIDELICAHFEWPCDADKYVFGWYNAIGFRAATGNSFEDMRNEFVDRALADKDDNYYKYLLQIVDFLEPRYDVNHWSCR